MRNSGNSLASDEARHECVCVNLALKAEANAVTLIVRRFSLRYHTLYFLIYQLRKADLSEKLSHFFFFFNEIECKKGRTRIMQPLCI